MRILKVSGANDSDREPLRHKQIADAEKQVSCLLGKTKQIPKIYCDVTFYGSSAEELRRS